MTLVVFRKENKKLASMCMHKFKSVAEAKDHIEADAQRICAIHSGIDLGWIKPKTLDYYCIELKTGVKCYWQYFNISEWS